MNNLGPVQTAVYGLLTTTPATYPVYDAVPQGAAKPYIVIGEVLAEQDEELATETTAAWFEMHTWSALAGKAQSHTMLQFIRARLHGVSVTGTWACFEDGFSITEDPKSTTSARLFHGRARYEVRVG